MTILKSKAKDDEAALRWALRGLEIYGERCITDGADDLRSRVQKLETKLGRTVMGTTITSVPARVEPDVQAAPPEAAWHPDPTGRFQHRYWNGVQWTDLVANDGVQGRDPLSS
jgi:hypothetical protein